MLKKIFLALLMAAVLVPNIALASLDSSLPEFNPLCWKQKDCEEMRRQLNPENLDTTGGWISPEPPCSGDWGKCLPSGITKTEISFGGRSEFLHLGDFIQYMYRYAVSIAAIVAVIVLMTAGYEWITSGGNSERISSAKKRIGGALMGLFLAFMSYFILNVINPNLVQFRLPQVWMVRPQRLVPPFCGAAASTTVFADSNSNILDQTTPLPATSTDFDTVGVTYSGKPAPEGNNKINTNWKRDTFACGKRFFMKDGGESTCFGDVCPLTDGRLQVCTDLPYNGKPAQQLYYCMDGMLLGTIAGNAGGLSGKIMNSNVVEDNTRLLVLCKSGIIEEVDSLTARTDVSPATFLFEVPKNVSVENHCGGKEKIAGFYLGMEVNDQSGCGGKIIAGAPASCGAADWFAVGQSSPYSHDCSVNLARQVRGLYPDAATQGTQCGRGNLECTCGYLSLQTVAWAGANNPDFRKHLISLEELEAGYQCNVTLNISEFPPADNGVHWGDGNITGTLTKAAAAATACGAAGMIGTPIVAGATAGVCATVVGLPYLVVDSYNIFKHIIDDPTSCRDLQPNGGTNSFLGK